MSKTTQLWAWVAVTGGLVWFLFLRKTPRPQPQEKPGSTTYVPQQGAAAAQQGGKLAGQGAPASNPLGDVLKLIGGLFGKGSGSGSGSPFGFQLQAKPSIGGGAGGGGGGKPGGGVGQSDSFTPSTEGDFTDIGKNALWDSSGQVRDLMPDGFDYGDPGSASSGIGLDDLMADQAAETPWTGDTSADDYGSSDLGTFDDSGSWDGIGADDFASVADSGGDYGDSDSGW